MIGTIVVGFVAGLLARALHPGNDKLGWIKTTLLGVLGAITAGYLGKLAGFYQANEKAGLLGAVLGAVLLLSAYSYYQRRMTNKSIGNSDTTEV